MTIAYMRKGEADKYAGDTRFEGQKLTFNTVTFSPPEEVRAQRGRTEVPLERPSAKQAQDWDRLYAAERSDLLEAQRRMEDAAASGDLEGERSANLERDDIIQRLDTFDSLSKRDAAFVAGMKESDATAEMIRSDPTLTLAQAVLEGERRVRQAVADEESDRPENDRLKAQAEREQQRERELR